MLLKKITSKTFVHSELVVFFFSLRFSFASCTCSDQPANQQEYNKFILFFLCEQMSEQSKWNRGRNWNETNTALKVLHIVGYPNVIRSNAWKFEMEITLCVYVCESVCTSWPNLYTRTRIQACARTHTYSICKSHFTAKEIENSLRTNIKSNKKHCEQCSVFVHCKLRTVFFNVIGVFCCAVPKDIPRKNVIYVVGCPFFFYLHIRECTLRSPFTISCTLTYRSPF